MLVDYTNEFISVYFFFNFIVIQLENNIVLGQRAALL